MISTTEQSAMRWRQSLREGDEHAGADLWRLLAARIRELSSPEFHDDEAGDSNGHPRSRGFDSVCRAIGEGHFPAVPDRDQLWAMVATIAIKRAQQTLRWRNKITQNRRLHRPADTPVMTATSSATATDMKFACQQECSRLLTRLGTSEVKMVAVLKVEGLTNAEVTAELACTHRSLQRRMGLIRNLWKEERPLENTTLETSVQKTTPT